ncbi:BatD family protein [Pseudidiomarina insulisalsae]|uniref:DUF7939 domain-containing protein n=1 Tax=Pseudidiomarina insulisalsae TaxID=575789 RepID=A0A432YEN2_9GAMM|nr:BatD family protein [Pseudidiomarina insulisalsae]RUO59397.1 hypothetical protein CWI71_08180 [Pseudidiomarina insulisalsae]
MVNQIRFLSIAALSVAALCLSSIAMAQTDTAPTLSLSVNKNPVASGDTFILTLTVSELIEDREWRPAEVLTEFDVMGTSSSSTTQIINGETSREKTFRSVVRAPQEIGDYSIGPVALAGGESNQITLQVVAADAAELTEQRDAFMRVEIDRDEIYVQEQVELTTKLYLAANLHSGNIIPPQLEDADIRQVGRDVDSTEVIDGRMFQVFQRSFVVIPQRSGAQEIRGPVFQGQINVESNRTLFPSFSSTKSVTTAATNLPIEVLPIPAGWPAEHTWLPAELVTLSVAVGNEGTQQPDGETLQITQGEPLTLTYRLTAVGPLADQLPRLDELVRQLDVGDASVYPESPESAMNQRNGRLVSQQTLQVAIIPHSPGTLTVPALQVPWFNTQLRQQQMASAPAQRIEVAPGSTTGRIAPADGPDRGPISGDAAQQSQPGSQSATAGDTAEGMAEIRNLQLWQALTGIFLLLWLLTLAWLWRRRKAPVSNQEPSTTPAPRQDLKAIKQACLSNDAAATERALKEWMRIHLGLAGQLDALGDYLGHAPLRSQLAHLQRARFAASPQDWQEGKALWRALKSALQGFNEPDKATNKPRLPELYPPS